MPYAPLMRGVSLYTKNPARPQSIGAVLGLASMRVTTVIRVITLLVNNRIPTYQGAPIEAIGYGSFPESGGSRPGAGGIHDSYCHP